MTAEADLLPLPEPLLVRGDIGGLYTGRECQHYARANLAPLQAENERLRREMSAVWDGVQRVSPWSESNDMLWSDEVLAGVHLLTQDCEYYKARAERLAEALRWAERHCPCGARPESPDTHPHLPGCLVGAALAQEDRNG